jgi:alpha-1,6-mannosyltransferase
MEPSSTSFVSLQESFPRTSSRRALFLLLGFGIVLEALYLRIYFIHYLKNHAITFMVLALCAGVIYLVSLYALDRTTASRTVYSLLIFLAIVFRATLWPMEPTLSDDLQRYRWDGKVQAQGWNPYGIAPNDPRLAYLRDKNYEIMPGREIRSIYPPATQLIFRLDWKWFPGPTAFKVPFAAADVFVLLILAWIFRQRHDRLFRLAVYAWNPLVIIEFAASGHNDSLALLGIVAGIVLATRYKIFANVPIALAAMAKVFPAVLLPVWIRRAGWPEKRSGWFAAAIAAATVLLVLLPYWNALGMFRATLAYYEASWRNYHASLYTVIDWATGGHSRVPALAGILSSWGLSFWLAWKRAEPARAAYLLIGTILAFGPNGYSWYFTWIVPLLCFFPNPAWLLLTVLQFLSYNVLIRYGILGEFTFDPTIRWLVYAPFYLLLIGGWLFRRSRHQAEKREAPADVLA